MPRISGNFFWLVALIALSMARAQVISPMYAVTTITGASARWPARSLGGDAGSLARDSVGNLYIADRGGVVFLVTPDGISKAVAGRSVPGFDYTKPNDIHLGLALGVAVDATDALYIADYANNRVFRMTQDGAISLAVGPGHGAVGDGGPAIAATLNGPFGLVVDRAGNLYIGEVLGYRIRKVRPDGLISTVAGNGQPGAGGDGGPATEAQIIPWALALDDSGSLYVSDGVSRVRKITPDGIVNTIAGTGVSGFSGDGFQATSAQFGTATGIAVDHAGNLYVADRSNDRVRVVTPDGVINTFAGTGIRGFVIGAGRKAVLSQLDLPLVVLADKDGSVLIGENGLFVRVDTQGRILPAMQVANATAGTAPTGWLESPGAIAADPSGNVYIAETCHAGVSNSNGVSNDQCGGSRVRKMDQSGVLTTVAGTGELGFEGEAVSAITTPIGPIQGLAVDPAGNLYISDSANQRVRQVGADGLIRTVAGSGTAGFSGDGGPATAAQLSRPAGLALDAAGGLYIADSGNNRVRKVSADGTIGTVAGGGPEVEGLGDGGPATSASLRGAQGVAVDEAGNLYIAETHYDHQRVRKVSRSGIISTVAGGGPSQPTIVDGIPAVQATLGNPVWVVTDADGNLFISDDSDYNFRGAVRGVRPDGIIDTVAGGAQIPTTVDGSPGILMSLCMPVGIVTGAAGSLYIAEAGDSQFCHTRLYKATPLLSTGGAPRLLPPAVLSAAAFAQGPVAPGEVVTLLGTDLGPAAGASAQPDASGCYPTQLAGVTVSFDQTPATILLAKSDQINAIVPFGITPKDGVQVVVQYNGKTSAPIGVTVYQAAPEFFRFHQTARQDLLAAFNEDGSINSPSNPAAIGSVITLYTSGIGAMNPPLLDGTVSASTTPKPVLPLSVVFQVTNSFLYPTPQTAEILYAGPAPGLVAGVIQINARVPPLFAKCDPAGYCRTSNVAVQIQMTASPNLAYPTFIPDTTTLAIR